jgi:hypothetical protein
MTRSASSGSSASSAWPLVAATGLHAGFQATVSVLVYPALAQVRDQDFPMAHDAHSRRITPLVALVYGGLAVACGQSLRSEPGSTGVRVAVLGSAGAGLVTAAVAAPTHGRLGRGRTPHLVSRLLVADRMRLACAVLAFGGAIRAAVAEAPAGSPGPAGRA